MLEKKVIYPCRIAMVFTLLIFLSFKTEAQDLKGRGHELTIVGPTTRTAIVYPDKWQKNVWYDWGGHEIFNRFSKLITGKDLQRIPASKLVRGKFDVCIWIGRQPEVDRVIGGRLDQLDDDGYLMAATGKNVYIAGKHWWGTNWAVYDLLESYAGCRWYLMEPRWWQPDQDGMLGPGDIIPKSASIHIPRDMFRIEEPDYKSRWFRFAPYHSFRLRNRDKFHHALRNIFPLEMYDQHPEYFPEIDGQRIRPVDSNQYQPCVSNPEVVQITANAAIRKFKEDPTLGSVSLGMNDSNRFCECQACLAIAPPEIVEKKQRIAYAFFDYYNQVARRVAKIYPDKRLGCLAYAYLRELPAGKIQLEPNLIPYLTLDSAQLFEPAQRIELRQSLQKWQKLSQHMGIYEYMYGGGFLIPRIYNGDLADNLKSRYGVKADGFYAEAYPNWGLDGPKYWLASKLLWDTSLDPNVLLNQFYGDMFGRQQATLTSHADGAPRAVANLSQSAELMKQYFELLETAWRQQQPKSKKSNYRWLNDPTQLAIFSPQTLQQAQQLLDQANDAAASKTIRRRVEYFRTSFQVTRVACARYAYAKSVEELAKASPNDMDGLIEGINNWLSAGDLDKAIANAQSLGVAALNDAGNALDTAKERFDQHPITAFLQLADLLTDRAIQAFHPASRMDYEKVVVRSVPRNVPDMLTDLMQRRSLFVQSTKVQPEIDGLIQQRECGEPAFSGRFYASQGSQSRLDKLDENLTRVWCHTVGNELYLGFQCQQDPETVGSVVKEDDTTSWRDADMLNDDCIVLSFFVPKNPLRSIRINSNGAVSDFEGTNLQWNGTLKSAALKTKSGWQAELLLDLKQLQIDRSKPVEMSVARYTRRADPENKGKFVTKATTLVPFPLTGSRVGHGNHPHLMIFRTGTRLIFKNEDASNSTLSN